MAGRWVAFRFGAHARGASGAAAITSQVFDGALDLQGHEPRASAAGRGDSEQARPLMPTCHFSWLRGGSSRVSFDVSRRTPAAADTRSFGADRCKRAGRKVVEVGTSGRIAGERTEMREEPTEEGREERRRERGHRSTTSQLGIEARNDLDELIAEAHCNWRERPRKGT